MIHAQGPLGSLPQGGKVSASAAPLWAQVTVLGGDPQAGAGSLQPRV